jgi:CcmD family protein
MKTLKRWCALVWLSVTWGVVVAAQQPSQQGEFLPLDQLPPQERMAAAPLLIGAYAFVMAVLFLYVLSVARRLTNVQQEISRLDSAIKQGHKG